MRSNANATGYGATAISLHWIVALLIFAAFGLGLYMTGIPGLTPTKLKLFSWHKWLGVTVFGIAWCACSGARRMPRRLWPPARPRGRRRRQ